MQRAPVKDAPDGFLFGEEARTYEFGSLKVPDATAAPLKIELPEPTIKKERRRLRVSSNRVVKEESDEEPPTKLVRYETKLVRRSDQKISNPGIDCVSCGSALEP